MTLLTFLELLERNRLKGKTGYEFCCNGLKIMKKLILIFLLFTTLTSSAICTLIVDNGNWSNSSSWDCGYVPAVSGDTMVIPASMTCVIDLNSPTYVDMRIEVYGTMLFDNGRKINLDNDGEVIIHSGGLLTGGNSGSRLNIGEITWWSGTDPPVVGPTSLSNGGWLPVELIEFSAIENDGKVEILWVTASEINNDYFIVERSQNTFEWTSVIETKGVGTSNLITGYFEVDNNPLKGLSYYRLKQVDFNGEWKTFNIVPVENLFNGEGIMDIYPNPTTNGESINIFFSDLSKNKPEILVVLRDIKGREVYSKIEIIESNDELIALDIPPHLPPGTYLVVATSENLLYSKKIIIK